MKRGRGRGRAVRWILSVGNWWRAVRFLYFSGKGGGGLGGYKVSS